MLRTCLLVPLIASLCAVTPRNVLAQTSAENVAAARALGIQGVQLADDGKCAEAIGPLEKAEALYHAPSILGRLGECQVALGQLVLGTENLNRTVREALPANAPQVFRDAQVRAQKVLDSALPRIARLVIKVEPAAEGLKIAVDSAEVPLALLGSERPTDPGVHQVTASAPGFLPAESSVTLAEGSSQEITLTLVRDPATQAAVVPSAPAPAPKPVAPANAPDSGKRSNAAGYTLLGIGAVGLATGAITGLVAMRKENALECPEKECPPETHEDLEGARKFAMVSNIGFGVGIASAAVGVILLVSGGSSGEAKTTASHSKLTARPFVGARSLGIEGSF